MTAGRLSCKPDAEEIVDGVADEGCGASATCTCSNYNGSGNRGSGKYRVDSNHHDQRRQFEIRSPVGVKMALGRHERGSRPTRALDLHLQSVFC